MAARRKEASLTAALPLQKPFRVRLLKCWIVLGACNDESIAQIDSMSTWHGVAKKTSVFWASDERDDGGVGGASGTSERGWVSRRGKDEAHYEDQQCAIKLRQRGRSARERDTHTHTFIVPASTRAAHTAASPQIPAPSLCAICSERGAREAPHTGSIPSAVHTVRGVRACGHAGGHNWRRHNPPPPVIM